MKRIDWITTTFIVLYHVALAITLPIYLYFFPFSVGLLIASLVVAALTGLSITAGYHRLFSHTTYKTNPIIEFILLFFGSMSTQGSALRWSHDHRLHHAFMDTDRDPYCIKDGFLHAHILWMFKKQPEIQDRVVADLKRNKLLVFQDKYYVPCLIVTNLIPILLFGFLFHNFFGAIVLVWLVRLFLSHHSTWFINSLAHYWGARTFCREQTAVDNYLISLLTFGEGYHNYHHKFAKDYRNGVRWYHFDPTKWLIWTLSRLGLARDLKTVSNERIKAALITAEKARLLAALESSPSGYRAALTEKIEALSQELTTAFEKIARLGDSFRNAKKGGSLTQELKLKWQGEIQPLVQRLNEGRKSWKELRRLVESSVNNPMAIKSS